MKKTASDKIDFANKVIKLIEKDDIASLKNKLEHADVGGALYLGPTEMVNCVKSKKMLDYLADEAKYDFSRHVSGSLTLDDYRGVIPKLNRLCGNINETMLWLAERDVDLSGCKKFIKDVCFSRNVLTKLEELRGSVLDPFAPDPLFHVLNYGGSKAIIDFISKAPREQFNKLTTNGMPVWWGVFQWGKDVKPSIRNTLSELLSNKVDDFNQVSNGGDDILSYSLNAGNYFDYDFYSKDISPKELGSTNYHVLHDIIKSGKFNLAFCDENGKTPLHRFSFDKDQVNKGGGYNYNYEIIDDFPCWFEDFENILDEFNNNTKVSSLLLQQDNDGFTPIDNIFAALDGNPDRRIHSDYVSDFLVKYDVLDKIIGSSPHAGKTLAIAQDIFEDELKTPAVIINNQFLAHKQNKNVNTNKKSNQYHKRKI